MKLGEDVLLDIIDIVRTGIVEGRDISEMLRQIELESQPNQDGLFDVLRLESEYKKKRSGQS